MKNKFLIFLAIVFFIQVEVGSQNNENSISIEGGRGKDRQEEEYRRSDDKSFETTNFGVRINNTDSLKVGYRGPTLLQDFQFREKMTHFDHERIPERVVHARGSGAYGYFQSYRNWSNITRARFLQTTSTKTPVFVRFSTVLGSRGSADTARDIRGFATRFYTSEGLFDLVGNNAPVFFIQDAMKFPDLIHAAKPEQDSEVPTASSAHDTAFDFLSLSPESLHAVFWLLSDRGIPRSYRHMQGFGVHTFRLVNKQGKSVFVKWHWKSLQGLSSLVWDEAQKIAGKNPDFHRSDLWDAIEKGDFPEYELGVQIINEKDQFSFDFDILDPTKLIPEEVIPVTKLGKMTLDRNPDNFFSETEQITFHLGHVVPGIDFTNDPLLQGRLFSYTDTQINRLHTANFMLLPINRPINPVHNNQREGSMQTIIFQGKVAYFPNSLQKGYPQPASPEEGGFYDYPEAISSSEKIRGRPKSFFDFYSQPQLFWNSLTKAEQKLFVDSARFELGKVKSKIIRQRMIDHFNHIDFQLAKRVAEGVGIKPPTKQIVINKNVSSPVLSIQRNPKTSIRTSKVAFLVADGVNLSDVTTVYSYLKGKGCYIHFVAPVLGPLKNLDQKDYIFDTFATTDSVLFDAVYIPGGKQSIKLLSSDLSGYPWQQPLDFIRDSYRHAKPIAAVGEALQLLDKSGLPYARSKNTGKQVNEKDGVVTSLQASQKFAATFADAILTGRFWDRRPRD